MTWETYNRILEWGGEYSLNISIGGGEPTLHPQFKRFVAEALGSNSEFVWLATNGTNEKVSLWLHNLNVRFEGVDGFQAVLSRSGWHQEQDIQPSEEIVKKFKSMKAIHNEGYFEPSYVGRAKEIMDQPDNDRDRCCCDELFFDPQGTLWECGCKIKRLGNIWDENFHPDIDWEISCSKERA